MLIAFQGEPGAYSEAAALRYAPGADTYPCRSFEDVFAAVRAGRVSHGVLPMENSIGGSIHRNYDLLVEHELPIVGEVELLVEHCLLAKPGATVADLKTIYSHPQALAQCEGYLERLTGVEIVAVYDTAGGAKMVADGQHPGAGAVASRRAADVFGLAILQAGIQDFAANITRFVVIARSSAPPGEATKTSIVFALQNKPGADSVNEVMIGRNLVARHAIAAVEFAMEAAGGAGFYRAAGLERRFRDVQGARYHPLQTGPQALYAGSMALGLPIDKVF